MTYGKEFAYASAWLLPHSKSRKPGPVDVAGVESGQGEEVLT